MALSGFGLTDDNDHHVLPSLNISVPAREQPGVPEPDASPNLVGTGQGLGHPLPVLREQIGMPFSDVTFPFLGQLDLSVKVGAREPAH